ncbi:MAG: hypothetical protein WCQ00_03410 [bacterium]
MNATITAFNAICIDLMRQFPYLPEVEQNMIMERISAISINIEPVAGRFDRVKAKRIRENLCIPIQGLVQLFGGKPEYLDILKFESGESGAKPDINNPDHLKYIYWLEQNGF